MVAPAIIAALIGAAGSLASSAVSKSGQKGQEENDLLKSLLAKQQQPQQGGPLQQLQPRPQFSSFLQGLGG